jgi:hypothetical protein
MCGCCRSKFFDKHSHKSKKNDHEKFDPDPITDEPAAKRVPNKEKKCSKCNDTGKIFIKSGKSVYCPYCIDKEIAIACTDYSAIDKSIAKDWRQAEAKIREENCEDIDFFSRYRDEKIKK